MFPLLHCGYLEVRFISTKHLYLQNLSYIKKQQEQAEAQTKQYHQSNQQWKPVITFFVLGAVDQQLVLGKIQDTPTRKLPIAKL